MLRLSPITAQPINIQELTITDRKAEWRIHKKAEPLLQLPSEGF
jgi:hypothetical protein